MNQPAPAPAPEPKLQVIYVRCDRELKARVKERAKLEGVLQADLVIRVLTDYLEAADVAAGNHRGGR